MLRYLLIALGGAIGTLARHGLTVMVTARFSSFPVGTMVVNISGCFVIGLLATMAVREDWRDFLMIGFCGGFTTYSAFGLQTMQLAHGGAWAAAAWNVIGSNVLGLAGVYAGWWCGRFWPVAAR